MKKYILKAAIVFSISVIGVLNFNSLVSGNITREFNFNDLFTQANAACEQAYSSSSTTHLNWIAAPYWDEYTKSTTSVSFAGPAGCKCTESAIKKGCSMTLDCTSFCNPSITTSKSCS